jgi:hypothetical protein
MKRGVGMIDRRVKKLLLDRLRITPQALSQRAKKMKSAFGPMSTEEAVYVIAHQEGVDLTRLLSIGIIDRVRSLVPKELPRRWQAKAHLTAKTKKDPKGTRLYPLVKKSLISQSVRIGQESFPQLFILENSIRNVIIQKLGCAYGKQWWNKANIRGVRDDVQRTIDKEKKYPHRQKRGSHPIYYSNFAHLKQIILNERKHFAGIIVDFKWFEVEMNEVYMPRNLLAHSIVIGEDDASRIRLFYRDWARLLESAGCK